VNDSADYHGYPLNQDSESEKREAKSGFPFFLPMKDVFPGACGMQAMKFCTFS
jgi:hypothetical protein